MSKNRENNKPKNNNIEIIFDDEENFDEPSEHVKKEHGRRSNKKSRMENKLDKNDKKNKKNKKKMSKKKKIIITISIILGIFLLLGVVFGVYLFKAKGNVKDAVLNIATDIVGDQDPIFVLILGVSEDISAKLTDTIILCGYNPSTQKAFMLSVPRDTFVGKSESYANGYDKINAQFQKSAEKTVEAVELLTGIKIDHYMIVRNISITSIFECFGSIDFDVPINMNYDDPTQDLHIHLKKGYQTLQPNQIEQLLRFRHNNDGSSYPSSYGDNDYGRMRTQREFIKAAMEQILSVQNAGKLKDLAAMVYTNLQTNMSGHKVLDYVPHALKFSTSNLRSEQLPGQSAMINELWFYRASKSQTKKLMDELMIYLELDDKTLDSHYKYASEIKGVKPDQNWVSNEVVIDDDYDTTNVKKDKDKDKDKTDPEKCEHQYAVYDDSDAAGCEKTGTVVYKCLKCQKEYQKQTDALGHNYKDGKCTRCGKADPSYKKPIDNTTNDNTVTGDDKNNTVDEDKKPEHTHKYIVDKTASKSPTCTEKGLTVKKCECGKTITEELPAKGHSFGGKETCSICGEKNPNYKPPEPPTNTVTPPTDGSESGGDNTNTTPTPPDNNTSVPDNTVTTESAA